MCDRWRVVSRASGVRQSAPQPSSEVAHTAAALTPAPSHPHTRPASTADRCCHVQRWAARRQPLRALGEGGGCTRGGAGGCRGCAVRWWWMRGMCAVRVSGRRWLYGGSAACACMGRLRLPLKTSLLGHGVGPTSTPHQSASVVVRPSHLSHVSAYIRSGHGCREGGVVKGCAANDLCGCGAQ